MAISIRRAKPEDRAKAVEAEGKATPSLHYLDAVYDAWVADREGELIVGEVDGEVVAVGKYSLIPDGSAWLETLRVDPAFQGRGIGKRFYDRFFELATLQKIPALRMYTNLTNVVSKGLAERYGLRVAGTFQEATLDVPAQAAAKPAASFQPVTNPAQAAKLLLPLKAAWSDFVIFNRTFYAFNPSVCAAFAAEGKVYADPATGAVVVLGARFMPDQALHVALFSGDPATCLEFARQKAAAAGIPQVKCMFDPKRGEIKAALEQFGFAMGRADFITMEGPCPRK